MKKLGIILQARTASTRLPSKVLKPLCGIPLLSHCIRRLKKIDRTYPVIVATSDLPENDSIEKIAKNENVYCFRGSEKDVLDRYYQTAKLFNLDFIIRATGDNPLVDHFEAKNVANCIISYDFDYVTNIPFNKESGLPVGVGVDAFTVKALERSWMKGHAKNHREHINEYILENVLFFNIARIQCSPKNNCPALRLTVDTDKDFKFIEEILRSIKKRAVEIQTRDIIEWWRKKR